MKEMLNIAESGTGSYRMLAILRWVMVVIFVSFGMQKFTLQSAQGIAQFITNSPFISWLSVFGLRGEAYFLGVAEFVIAALLVAGAFNPFLSALGSLQAVLTKFCTMMLPTSRRRASLRMKGSSDWSAGTMRSHS